ncbi:Gfo/Idh/MocA family oxidoreductase [Candidatus Poribacteria bacterium]|nr:Gfo/Idh/MocA family oxidoreductase [Candidatus Poribacteria bacterium]
MTLKAGFIGTGGISRKHLTAMAEMKDKVEITALCDAREEAARAKAAEFGGRVYTDYRKMLDDETLDILFICVPPDSHKDMEVKAAEKGLHLMVEKPVNLYLDDAIRANEAIKKAGVVTCVGYTAGYSNVDQAIKKFLADKKIGMVSSERWGGVAGDENHWWRVMDRSGGMLHEQATHQLNTVRYFAGDVAEVYKNESLRINTDMLKHTIPDCEIVNMVFKSGAIGYITTTSALTKGGGTTHIDMIVEGHLRLQIGGREGVSILPAGFATIEIENKPEMNLDQAFIAAILTGDKSLVKNNFEDGLKTTAITLAANKSAKTGMPEKVYQP